MGARPKLITHGAAGTRRSQPRQLLAIAIQQRDQAAKTAADAQAAVGRAQRMLAQAEAALEEANRAVEAEKERLAATWGAAATEGIELAPSGALQAARLLVADRTDAVTAAKAALGKLEAACPDAERELRHAEAHVLEAAGNVLRTELDVPNLMAQVRAAHDRLLAARAQLRWSLEHDLCPADASRANVNHADRMLRGSEAARLLANVASTPADRSCHSYAAMDQALDRLAHDPDAPLPG